MQKYQNTGAILKFMQKKKIHKVAQDRLVRLSQ